MKFRVPLPNDRQSFGFSARMLFLIWCVFGGFLLHFFESLFLESLLKTNYEKPVDTAQDVVDRGLTVIYTPGAESMAEMVKNSPSSLTRRLAELIAVPKVIFCYKGSLQMSHFSTWRGLG